MRSADDLHRARVGIDREAAELFGNLGAASRAAAASIATLGPTMREVGRVMALHRRRWQLAAYRSGLVPWPTPSGCYRHRTRWAGRAPQRRKGHR